VNEPLLEVKNLKKYFPVGTSVSGKFPRYKVEKLVLKAVDDVSFTIPQGITLGLVGESGCGKTTVGRTILRLYEADSGQVLYRGRDITHLPVSGHKELTRKMQMIFQDPYASLDPRCTVGEIIGEGLTIHKLCDGEEEKQQRIGELLEMVGLNKEHKNRLPHEFSGGQRQRVGIARALSVNPEFIVCDEAISALDVSIQAQIINLLMKLQKEMGLTYLFIAHDLSMVRHISDQTAVMYLGALVETGATDKVYTNPIHPYTKGLLASVPAADPDYETSREKPDMKGEVGSPINPKPGCRFCDRCKYAEGICRNVTPSLKDMGGGHMVACHMVSQKNQEEV
jgi:oligopeptide transport system ATP-binding protein